MEEELDEIERIGRRLLELKVKGEEVAAANELVGALRGQLDWCYPLCWLWVGVVKAGLREQGGTILGPTTRPPDVDDVEWWTIRVINAWLEGRDDDAETIFNELLGKDLRTVAHHTGELLDMTATMTRGLVLAAQTQEGRTWNATAKLN